LKKRAATTFCRKKKSESTEGAGQRLCGERTKQTKEKSLQNAPEMVG